MWPKDPKPRSYLLFCQCFETDYTYNVEKKWPYLLSASITKWTIWLKTKHVSTLDYMGIFWRGNKTGWHLQGANQFCYLFETLGSIVFSVFLHRMNKSFGQSYHNCFQLRLKIANTSNIWHFNFLLLQHIISEIV